MLVLSQATLNNKLKLAAATGCVTLLVDSLDVGADANHSDGGETALHQAARRGFTCVVEHLLNRGADLNASAFGWTPLHKAVLAGHLDVVQLLVNKGADVGTRINGGYTALDLADNPIVRDFLRQVNQYYHVEAAAITHMSGLHNSCGFFCCTACLHERSVA